MYYVLYNLYFKCNWLKYSNIIISNTNIVDIKQIVVVYKEFQFLNFFNQFESVGYIPI